MSVKTVFDINGKPRRLGRNRPPAAPKLHFKDYIRAVLPKPPKQWYLGPLAQAALNEMYGNDTLGDCVIAMMGHVEGVWTGNAGAEVIYKESEVVAEYSAIGGYVPGNPSTDNGCDEVTAFDYWQSTGFPREGEAHKIAGWLAVDATNIVEVHQAIWLFENLCVGVELPDAWINPFPSASNFAWWVNGPPDPENGHAFNIIGYHPGKLRICTWGMQGQLTNQALATYMVPSAGGGLYVAMSQDILDKATQKSPTGLNWAALQVDFGSI